MTFQLETCRRWIHANWLLILLLAVCLTRLWLMPLPSSLWTDETGTAFVVQHPADPSLAVAPQVPASVYYVLPRIADTILGFSEISYRIPSVLLMVIALFVIGCLAARLIDPGAAWFAVFACLAIDDFNFYAIDARPYALGICVTAASLWFLIEWLDTARWLPAFLFVLFAALLWRVQLVFWAFYPVFAIYTLVRLIGSSTKVGWLRALFVAALLAVALIPVAVEALAILRDAKAHVIAPAPGIRAFLQTPGWEWIALAALALVFAHFLKWRIQQPLAPTAVALIGAWWLWMPLCLFAYSRLTHTVLFVSRYHSPALPGIALAVTAATALYLPRARWKQASVLLAIAALIAAGHWSELWPDHFPDTWREASLEEDLAAAESDTPVLAVSPFIEAQPPAWNPEYRLPGFLYAQLFVYPLRGRVYPFPFVRSEAAEQYAAGLLRDTLLKRSRFIVYGAGRDTLSWVLWFTKRPELADWRYIGGGAKAIDVAVFENPGSAAGARLP
jgi:Dolichyl-phosphate-mannose-protein mannosyltransferase